MESAAPASSASGSSSGGDGTGERPYHSPLREAQADRTRTEILDAMLRLLADGGADEFSVRRLAAEAGVSERTVYRYFPDREALLDGVNLYLTDITQTGGRERELADLYELAALVPKVFAEFDEFPEAAKAAVLLNPDPGRAVPNQRHRSEQMIEVARRTFPDLPADEQRRLGIAVRTITSTVNWLRMRDEFGMRGEEAGELLGWVIRCMTDEVARTGHVGPGRGPV